MRKQSTQETIESLLAATKYLVDPHFNRILVRRTKFSFRQQDFVFKEVAIVSRVSSLGNFTLSMFDTGWRDAFVYAFVRQALRRASLRLRDVNGVIIAGVRWK